jgi:hypothetical protein
MKFLGFHIDNHLNWTNHIHKLIPKLSDVMQLDLCFMSATLTLLNQFILPIFTL